MPLKTLEQLMALRREYVQTVAFHKKQIALASKQYKATIKAHNKAVQKQRARLQTAHREQYVSPSTLRRWARAVRHGDLSD
jgi:hypothetical protein